LLSAAPAVQESLSNSSADHFAQLQELLAAGGITPTVNPRLVRGLDYYCHTVFEWTTELLGAQSAVCAGGRYDGLVEQLGGKATPGVGWAMGMERMIELVRVSNEQLADDSAPDIFVIVTSDVAASLGFAAAEELRSALPHAAIRQNLVAGSLKSQFKRADRSGARYALVIGSAEAEAGTVTLKSLRDGSDLEGQETETMANIINRLQQALALPD